MHRRKNRFFFFWETYFRNFWKFISVNIVYGLFCVPIITNGFANVGITNITRNIAIDKHSFLLTDFFETIKSNWKQAAIVGVINGIIYALLFYSFYSYCFSENAKIISIGTGVCLSLFVIFTFMNFYIWTFLITFNYSVFYISFYLWRRRWDSNPRADHRPRILQKGAKDARQHQAPCTEKAEQA